MTTMDEVRGALHASRREQQRHGHDWDVSDAVRAMEPFLALSAAPVGRQMTFDLPSGAWVTQDPISAQDGYAISASVLPGVTPELIERWYSMWLSDDRVTSSDSSLTTASDEVVVSKAAAELAAWGLRSAHGDWRDDETQTRAARDVLKAIRPLIEAQVRESVAAEIETDRAMVKHVHGDQPSEMYIRGVLYGESVAATIARGHA